MFKEMIELLRDMFNGPPRTLSHCYAIRVSIKQMRHVGIGEEYIERIIKIVERFNVWFACPGQKYITELISVFVFVYLFGEVGNNERMQLLNYIPLKVMIKSRGLTFNALIDLLEATALDIGSDK